MAFLTMLKGAEESVYGNYIALPYRLKHLSDHTGILYGSYPIRFE